MKKKIKALISRLKQRVLELFDLLGGDSRPTIPHDWWLDLL